ncbi:MAG: tRNA (adenosine(37)-N6)-threonylcarbamoyltransferase complex dimerization subunit type 1 TsaB [Sulfurifustaceae bacterium]
MKLLAFDTATDVCTVAVWVDGAVCEREETGQRHAERILVMIDDALADAGVALRDLNAIAFGRGPGSFTGLRISAGVAQGLAFAAGLPVVPVSSLAALAQGVDAPRVLAALDARMQQVYWGAYARNAAGLVALEGTELVVAPADVPSPAGSGWIGTGSGWDRYADTLQRRVGDRLTRWLPGRSPRARFIAEIAAPEVRAGRTVVPEQALPVYLRDEVAAKKRA